MKILRSAETKKEPRSKLNKSRDRLKNAGEDLRRIIQHLSVELVRSKDGIILNEETKFGFHAINIER